MNKKYISFSAVAFNKLRNNKIELQPNLDYKDQNDAEIWNKLWKEEGKDTWRNNVLSDVYNRIVDLVPKNTIAIDIGGGIGTLAGLLKEKCDTLVIDHSNEAIQLAKAAEINAKCELINEDWIKKYKNEKFDIFISTEFFEHIDENIRIDLFKFAAKIGKAFISVPNNRLGPDEEPQHTIKYTAKSFLDELHKYFKYARVEVMGQFLLGVCGFEKDFSLSVCMPARNEEYDIEATLASFRGIADQLVVGLDPRSNDKTREICKTYCDLIFDIENPQGPPEDKVPETGVHFAWIRNQCMNKCIGDWIFMTEAHERLISGEDTLLHLNDIMPKEATIGFVLRTGDDQQWAFPWLCRNSPYFRYKRATHNVLDYPDGSYVVQLPQIRTLHERFDDATIARAEQRKVQNRKTLMDDWMRKKNENSLHYLGAEWRGIDDNKAIQRLEEYLQQPAHNGPMRYHTRLILAKLYANKQQYKEARKVLINAVEDDWSRIEHWIWLGDIAYTNEKYEEALQFYRYAGLRAGDPPFTLWWVDLSMYSYIPAQRLAMIYSEMGMYSDAYHWAVLAKDFLPEDSPEKIFEEANNNIVILKEVLENVK